MKNSELKKGEMYFLDECLNAWGIVSEASEKTIQIDLLHDYEHESFKYKIAADGFVYLRSAESMSPFDKTKANRNQTVITKGAYAI